MAEAAQAALSASGGWRPLEGRRLRLLIARKLHVTQPAVTEHLKILSQAGFLKSKRIKKWTLYRRDENAIRQIKRAVSKKI